jgi:tetratricopeptide (TPR) repeat protein
MRARTIWLTLGGIVAALAAVVVIPQTRNALVDALYNDEAFERCTVLAPEVAIPGCNDALARHPNLTELYKARAMAYAKTPQHDLAIRDIEEFLRSAPEDVQAHEIAGIEYFRVNDYDRTIAHMDAALKYDPENAHAFWYRGLAKREKGDAAGADGDLKEAYRLDPALEGEDAVASCGSVIPGPDCTFVPPPPV